VSLKERVLRSRCSKFRFVIRGLCAQFIGNMPVYFFARLPLAKTQCAPQNPVAVTRKRHS
jgi:hypothetical protein